MNCTTFPVPEIKVMWLDYPVRFLRRHLVKTTVSSVTYSDGHRVFMGFKRPHAGDGFLYGRHSGLRVQYKQRSSRGGGSGGLPKLQGSKAIAWTLKGKEIGFLRFGDGPSTELSLARPLDIPPAEFRFVVRRSASRTRKRGHHPISYETTNNRLLKAQRACATYVSKFTETK